MSAHRAPPTESIVRARGITYAYPRSGRPALSGVQLDVTPGSIYAVIGPNGSGKSTLLKVLLGVLEPDHGSVDYRSEPVGSWSRRELALRVGVVPQMEETTFPVTVRELVAMGRYPHLGPWRPERDVDRKAIGRALARCDVGLMEQRRIDTLSGGERQRARIARALAQEPEALVLDEPTAALDIRHEMSIFELLARLANDDGVTVIVVTHNLNLAARYASRLLLLDEGRTVAEGAPDDVLTREVVERVYGWPVVVSRHPGPGPDQGAPLVLPLARPAAEKDVLVDAGEGEPTP